MLIYGRYLFTNLCVYICSCMGYIHLCVCMCVYLSVGDIYLLIYVSACMYAHLWNYLYACVWVCSHMGRFTYVLVCEFAHVWRNLFMCLCMGMLMYWVGCVPVHVRCPNTTYSFEAGSFPGLGACVFSTWAESLQTSVILSLSLPSGRYRRALDYRLVTWVLGSELWSPGLCS